VLDPQDELPAVLAGEGVVEEGDVRRAHVRVARGARGYARPDRHGTVEAITRPAAAQAWRLTPFGPLNRLELGEWRYRLGVRTDGSQPSNQGSIPCSATNPPFQ